MKIISIVGARPQFIKLAPFAECCRTRKGVRHLIVHTGQHYDANMSKIFFAQLGIPRPDYNLGIGSGPHGRQTGRMLEAVERVLLKEKPDWVVVYGDTNSTLAGALAAVKLHLPLAHVESGLRSFNPRMPEEINRVVADHCSNVLFCPTKTAVDNLKKEGFSGVVGRGALWNPGRNRTCFLPFPLVVNVGDVMFDALRFSQRRGVRQSVEKKYCVKRKEYFLLTVHRAENTDEPGNMEEILSAAEKISESYPVVFPVHPRVKKTVKNRRYQKSRIHFIEPVGYFEMLALEDAARAVLTDSGGVQKEAFLLQVPCVTLRQETEWEETLTDGWNRLAGASKGRIIGAVNAILRRPVGKRKQKAFFGDGKASERILKILMQVKRP